MAPEAPSRRSEMSLESSTVVDQLFSMCLDWEGIFWADVAIEKNANGLGSRKLIYSTRDLVDNSDLRGGALIQNPLIPKISVHIGS